MTAADDGAPGPTEDGCDRARPGSAESRGRRGGGGAGRTAARSVAEARAAQESMRGARAEARAERMAAAFPGSPPGRSIRVASWCATATLTVVSVLALLDTDGFLGAYFVVTFSLFALGAALLALDVLLAAARSRSHLMGIGGLFLLLGSAPRQVQTSLNGSLAAAVVVSVATAVLGFSTPELAFGTLVPMLQLSLSGLWGVRHGLFPPRGNGVER